MAAAQPMGPPAHGDRAPRFFEAGWTIVPDVRLGDGHIRGILAWADEEILVGDNLGVIWFERNPDESWGAWSWEDVTVGEAVNVLRDQFQDPLMYALEPDLEEFALGAGLGQDPTRMSNGLLETDPFQGVVAESQTPNQIVAPLDEIGWISAPVLSELLAKPPINMSGISIKPSDLLLNEIAFDTYQQLALRGDTSIYGRAGGMELSFSGRGTFPVAASSGPSRIPDFDPNKAAFFCGGCGETLSGPITPDTAPGGGPVGWRVSVILFNPANNRTTCLYSRSAIAPCFGVLPDEYGFFCTPCPGGTTMRDGDEVRSIILTLGPDESCPETPPAGATASTFTGCL